MAININIPTLVSQTITNGETSFAPSENAVFDALALKQNAITNPVTGTGANGQISFWTGTGLQSGDNGLFWDNTNKSLGIGTNTPNTKLHLSGSTTASGAIARGGNLTPTLVAAANNDVLVGLDVNATFTNGAFTGVSNIGLRLTALGPIQKTITTSNSGDFVIAGATSNSRLFLSGGGYTTDATSNGTAYIRLDGTSSGNFEFGFGQTSSLSLFSVTGNTYTSRFRIQGSTGNVGIGQTTDAGFRLDVNGTARVQGNFTLTAGSNIVLQTTTGTRIGTATNQLLSLWNATPNVQPTTAITAGAFVSNTSAILNDTATFDGYTIGQVVAALRRIGALA
jgi:hypothetical protein